MKTYGVVCWAFLIAAAAHASATHTGADVIPHLTALFADDLSYESCDLTLRVNERRSDVYYFLDISNTNTGTEESIGLITKSLIADNGSSEFTLRIHSFFSGYKILHVVQELQTNGSRSELKLVWHSKLMAKKLSRRIGILDGFGSSKKNVGYAKHTLKIVVDGGEVKDLSLREKGYRKVLGRYIPYYNKSVVSCD